MKKYIGYLCCFLFLCLVGCQVKSTAVNQQQKGLQIVTSFYPIYALTKEVSGDFNQVRMVQSGKGIHDFEPSPADVQAIYDADLFVYHSHTLESWVKNLEENAADSHVKVFEAAQQLPLLKVPALEDLDAEQVEDEATLYDPHSWNDPILLAEEAKEIAKILGELDPAHKENYVQNARDFTARAEAITKKYQAIFQKVPSKHFVTQHTAFYYLAKRFDLEQLGIATITGQEPTARQLAEIQEFVKEYKIKTIFAEDNVSSKIAETVAASTGVKIKKLSPLEADPQNNKSLLENVEENLTILSQELKE